MSSPGSHYFQGVRSPEHNSILDDGEHIPEISLDGNQPGKYSSTISNILSKHCAEIKTSADDVLQPITSISRRKLKELVNKHNNEIFSFMARPDKTPHVIGLAESIFRRYGHEVPTIRGNNSNTVLRDLNLDASMSDVVHEFDENLKRLRTEQGGLDEFMKQIRWMFNQYKVIGEEVLRLETTLFEKIEMLDKVANRSSMISSLKNNEVLPELIETFGKYLESVYKSANFEQNYKELVEAYKKWNICRQIISLHNNFRNEIHDPQCSICLSEPITSAIVPCGHTFCGNCVKKQNTTCYICRGTIRERIKLFFT